MIDPIEQIFRDFYDDLMQPNDDGETRMIDYAYWAKQVRMVLVVDCACHESWREGSHSKYECHNGKNVGVLRAQADFHEDLKDFGHVKEDFLK